MPHCRKSHVMAQYGISNIFFFYLFQSVIFHEEGHPDFPWFKQCVTFNFFPTPTHKLIYNLFHMLAMYGLPLVIMTLSYSLILIEISKKTRQSRGNVYIFRSVHSNQFCTYRIFEQHQLTRAYANALPCQSLWCTHIQIMNADMKNHAKS